MIKTDIGIVQMESDFGRIPIPRNTIRFKSRISKRRLRNKSIINNSKLQIKKHTGHYFDNFNGKNLYMRSYFIDNLKIRSFVYTDIRDLSKKKKSHYIFGGYKNRKFI